MLHFFLGPDQQIFLTQSIHLLSTETLEKLFWLFQSEEDQCIYNVPDGKILGNYIGPRATMVTPWSTNAVEITQNMGIESIL